MFNPYQRGGIGTVMGDIDRAAHTHKLGRLDKRQEALNTGLTTQDSGSTFLCLENFLFSIFLCIFKKNIKE